MDVSSTAEPLVQMPFQFSVTHKNSGWDPVWNRSCNAHSAGGFDFHRTCTRKSRSPFHKGRLGVLKYYLCFCKGNACTNRRSSIIAQADHCHPLVPNTILTTSAQVSVKIVGHPGEVIWKLCHGNWTSFLLG